MATHEEAVQARWLAPTHRGSAEGKPLGSLPCLSTVVMAVGTMFTSVPSGLSSLDPSCHPSHVLYSLSHLQHSGPRRDLNKYISNQWVNCIARSSDLSRWILSSLGSKAKQSECKIIVTKWWTIENRWRLKMLCLIQRSGKYLKHPPYHSKHQNSHNKFATVFICLMCTAFILCQDVG